MNSSDTDSPHDPVARATAVVGAGVIAARIVIIDATTRTRRLRETAVKQAAEDTADQAAQDAVATRYREEAAARHVRRDADANAKAVRQAEVDPGGADAILRATAVATAVLAAATAVAVANTALARAVSDAVALRAELVAASQMALDSALDHEIATAAVALHTLAQETTEGLAVA